MGENVAEMKNRSHRYNINKHRLKHGHKYAKYKVSQYDGDFMYCKQHLSNIWSSIYEKVKQLEKRLSGRKHCL